MEKHTFSICIETNASCILRFHASCIFADAKGSAGRSPSSFVIGSSSGLKNNEITDNASLFFKLSSSSICTSLKKCNLIVYLFSIFYLRIWGSHSFCPPCNEQIVK